MRKASHVILLGALFLLTSSIVDAQRFTKRKQYWSVGGSINTMNYFGDITDNPHFASVEFSHTKPNIAAEVMKRLTPRVSVRGQLFWGLITGDDADSEDSNGHENRDQSFSNHIQELSVQGIFDLYENRGTFLKRPDYTPYGMLGLGVFHNNPTINGGFNYNDVAHPDDVTSRIQVAILYGVGFRYKLARQWDIALEIGWRKTFTDNLDGLSGDYRPATDFDNVADYNQHDRRDKDKGKGNLDEPRAMDGNDTYVVTGFHVTYILAGGVKCPKFR